jgi:hypothetical protein
MKLDPMLITMVTKAGLAILEGYEHRVPVSLLKEITE